MKNIKIKTFKAYFIDLQRVNGLSPVIDRVAVVVRPRPRKSESKYAEDKE